MDTKQIAPLLTVASLAGLREFYTTHFGLKVTFESDGYLALALPGDPRQGIAYMTAGDCGGPVGVGAGLTWCFEVADVDAEHDRLRGALEVIRPLQDNPWGDRSFVVKDPAGVAVYVHHPIPPAPEFAGCAKE